MVKEMVAGILDIYVHLSSIPVRVFAVLVADLSFNRCICCVFIYVFTFFWNKVYFGSLVIYI